MSLQTEQRMDRMQSEINHQRDQLKALGKEVLELQDKVILLLKYIGNNLCTEYEDE